MSCRVRLVRYEIPISLLTVFETEDPYMDYVDMHRRRTPCIPPNGVRHSRHPTTNPSTVLIAVMLYAITPAYCLKQAKIP